MKTRASWLAAALMILGASFVAFRVAALAKSEVEVAPPWVSLEGTLEDGALEPHQELARTHLRAGTAVLFEACLADPLDTTARRDSLRNAFDFAIWRVDSGELVRRAPLDVDAMRRNSDGACVVLGEGASLEAEGDYAIEVVWPDRPLSGAAQRTPVRGRIVSHTAIGGLDRLGLLVAALGALLALGLRLSGPKPTPREGNDARGALRALAGFAGLGFAIAGLALVPYGGSVSGLTRGLCLALVQIAIAVALRSRAEPIDHALAFSPSRLGWLVFFVAPTAGLVLYALSMIPSRIIPSTGEAPIEALVAMPSGMLSVALVAVVAPIAEELFFRGLVYGSIEARYGRVVAVILATIAFAVVHLPQTYGAWGALLAIAITGFGLTLVRATTGSTAASALAHLTYNLLIAGLAVT